MSKRGKNDSWTDPQGSIIAAICGQILSGELKPGDQLPPIATLKKEFGVAIVTMQRVMEKLKANGITTATRGRGTYISENTPCLRRLGMVFPALPGTPAWSLMYTAMQQAGETVAKELGLETVTYLGQGGVRDNREHERLIRDIEAFRLCGILFAVHPFELAGTLAMAACLPIPRVAVMTGAGYDDLCAIHPGYPSFNAELVSILRNKQCRRMACIATSNWPRDRLSELVEAIRSGGSEVPERWIQAVPYQEPHWARNCAHNLFASDRSSTPEGLVITDDHLVEATLEGLRLAGRKPGEDVQVIAHRNHPSPLPVHAGVDYLGCDFHSLVRQALITMERKRTRQPFAQATTMPAVFLNPLLTRD